MFNKKLEELKKNRSVALNNRISVQRTISDKTTEDNFNNEFLWGDGINIGVQNLIFKYLNQKNLLIGRTWNSPSLANYTKVHWDTELAASLSQAGDNKFYITGANNIASEEINTSYSYLNFNGENAETSGGLIGNINSLFSSIGLQGTRNSPLTESGILTQAAAITEYNSAVADENGTGLYGARTTVAYQDSSAPGVITGTDPNWSYNGSIISPLQFTQPTFYSGSLRTSFLNSLNSLVSNMQIVIDDLISLREEIIKIRSGENTLFEQFKEEIAEVQDINFNLLNNITMLFEDKLQVIEDYQNYFENAIGDELDFDSELIALQSYVNTNLRNAINARANSINGLTGDGNPNFTGLRKWRLFWILARIGKPNGSLYSIVSLQTALQSAIRQVDQATGQLNIILPNTSEWIPKPRLFAAYFEPIRDRLGILVDRRVGLVFDGQQHANSYRIFKKEVTEDFSFDNEQWGISDQLTITFEINENGFVSTVLFDELITDQDNGKVFAYRIQTLDDGSSSVQSDLFSDVPEFNFSNEGIEQVVFSRLQYDVSKLRLDKDHKIGKGNYVVIRTTLEEGIYLVLEKENDVLYVYPEVNAENGFINSITTVVPILEEQVPEGGIVPFPGGGDTTIDDISPPTTIPGFVRVSASGLLVVDTKTYLTENQTIVLSGDVNGSGRNNIETSIANGSVTVNKLQQIPSGFFLGRSSSGTGSVQILSSTQVIESLGVLPTSGGTAQDLEVENDSVLNKIITKGVYENLISLDWDSNTQEIDLDEGNVFIINLTEDVTSLSFVNPRFGVANSFTLFVNQTATFDIDWPASVKWPDDGLQPFYKAENQLFIFTFMSIDGGTNWYGFLAGGEFA